MHAAQTADAGANLLRAASLCLARPIGVCNPGARHAHKICRAVFYQALGHLRGANAAHRFHQHACLCAHTARKVGVAAALAEKAATDASIRTARTILRTFLNFFMRT